MSKLRLTVASMMLVSVLGCPKDKAAEPSKEPAKPASGSQPAQAAQPGMPATAGQGKMAHCPSTVAGAQTAIADAADAVVITVTAPANNNQAIEEIRTRSKHLAEVSTKNPAEVKHDGEGDGGGGLGNCPIVLADTTITTEDVPNGSKLTVKPSKADDLPKLKQLSTERKSKLNPAQ